MLVGISLIFFLIRGVSSVFGAAWLKKKWAKISPHLIDTLLLGTGVALTFVIGQYPLTDHWLTVKLGLLVAYILFGMKAMKARTKSRKLVFLGCAVASVLLLISVARTHHPLGVFAHFV